MKEETKKRSLVKSIAWRLMAVTNGFLVALFFLNDLSKSAIISIVANVTGFVLYYIHERVWNVIKWEKK